MAHLSCSGHLVRQPRYYHLNLGSAPSRRFCRQPHGRLSASGRNTSFELCLPFGPGDGVGGLGGVDSRRRTGVGGGAGGLDVSAGLCRAGGVEQQGWEVGAGGGGRITDVGVSRSTPSGGEIAREEGKEDEGVAG